MLTIIQHLPAIKNLNTYRGENDAWGGGPRCCHVNYASGNMMFRAFKLPIPQLGFTVKCSCNVRLFDHVGYLC